MSGQSVADLIVLAPFLSLSQSESVPGIAAHSLLDGFLSSAKKNAKNPSQKTETWRGGRVAGGEALFV